MKKSISIILCIVLLCTSCAGALAETLTMQGGCFNTKTNNLEDRRKTDTQWYLKYHEENPDVKISLITNQKTFSTGELRKVLKSKSLKSDLFVIRSSVHDHRAIMSSGFCMDLSDNQVITELLSQMHPTLVEACSFDGKVYGVPMSITPWYFTHDKYAWAAAGLTQEDIPTSYTSLLDFLERWCELIKNKQMNVSLYYGFDGTSYRATSYTNWLMELLVENYCMQCESQGAKITFDTPEFKTLLERTKAVGALLYEYENPKAERYLFGEVFTPIGYSGLDQLVPLRLTDEDPIFIKCNIEICAINTNSKNDELASSFLDFFMNFAKTHTYDVMKPTDEDAEHMMRYASLFTDVDRDVPAMNYNMGDAWARFVANRKAVIEDPSTDAAMREEYTAELPHWEDVAKKAAEEMYFASLDDLALYRSLLETFYFPSPDNFYARNEKEIRTQRHYYSEGKITVEKFVQRLDKLVE